MLLESRQFVSDLSGVSPACYGEVSDKLATYQQVSVVTGKLRVQGNWSRGIWPLYRVDGSRALFGGVSSDGVISWAD